YSGSGSFVSVRIRKIGMAGRPGKGMQNPEGQRRHDHRDHSRPADLPPGLAGENKRAAPESNHEILRQQNRGSAKTAHYAMHLPASPDKQRPQAMHNGRQNGVEEY